MQRLHSLNRRSFLKTLGTAALAAPFVTRDLIARPPGDALRHASFGAGGMAWSDLTEIANCPNVDLVAVAEVDLRRAVEVQKKFPHARVYQDWRELLDKEAKNIDSVNVSTPDHMHASIAMSAMERGKHVYCQKPLAHDLHEVRRLAEYARGRKLVTQMGIQIHATNHYRIATVLVQAGTIGKIKAVHSWCPKSWGDPAPRPDRSDPVPEDFDWDLWLGVCEPRPFLGGEYYHPANWRKRLDFGTGTFGDMGCHIFDPVFTAVGLKAPIAVRSEGPAPNAWNWAMDSRIEYTFPGTPLTEGPTLPVTWYDGDQKPPAELRAMLKTDGKQDDLPGTGSIFVGTQGLMVLPHWAPPLLYPDKMFDGMKFPAIASGNHWREFVSACRNEALTGAGFDYAGPLTEAVLLGGVASRFTKTTLKWDSAKLRFDHAEANRFVSRPYRAGWRISALA
jgi:hypothetical protein